MIYLDTCLLIYLVEKRPGWGERAADTMARQGNDGFAISALVKFECLVGPMKDNDREMERVYRDTFDDFELLDLPEAVYLRGAELRARFGLKTPDALHLACAQHHRCEALWTNDDRFNKASHGLARNIFV